MASSSRQMLTSCNSRESGGGIFLRRATAVGCSAAIQKRSVATVCLRRERSSRYSATTRPETEASSAANCAKVRLKKNISVAHALVRAVSRLLATPSSLWLHSQPSRAVSTRHVRLRAPPSYYSLGADQRSENHVFQRHRGRHARVPPAVADGDLLQTLRVLIERSRVFLPRPLSHLHLHTAARFGVHQLQLTVPGRLPVLLGPHLNQQEFVPVIGEVLQRLLAAVIIQEIGHDDQQPTLLVGRDKLPHGLIKAGAAVRLQPGEIVHHRGKSMPPAAADKSFAQPISKRLNADHVQPDQSHVTERGGQLSRILEFLF